MLNNLNYFYAKTILGVKEKNLIYHLNIYEHAQYSCYENAS
jgi:hypothetical protein